MNSRFVPITTAIVSLIVAFVLYSTLSGFLRVIVVSPLLFFVTWPSIQVSLFSSQEEVDKMTGADKLDEPINLYLLLFEIVRFSRFVLYGITVYLSFSGSSFYVVPLLAFFVCLVKTLIPVRFRLVERGKCLGGFVGILKAYMGFYIQDFIIVSIVYGIGIAAQNIV